MDKNDNLKNGNRIEMDQFDLVVIKESTEEVVDREAKSALEEGRKHHNLGRIGCWNIFRSGRTPLQICAVWEKMIRSKLADFILIHDLCLENVRVQGGQGWEEGSQQHKIRASARRGSLQETRRRNGGGGRGD
jgi:hypothetical protein